MTTQPVKVRFYAFGENGNETRIVDVPIETSALVQNDDKKFLDEVFRLGQNDFQGKSARSVSAGDVVELPSGKGRYLVKSIGFAGPLTAEQQKRYAEASEDDKKAIAWGMREI